MTASTTRPLPTRPEPFWRPTTPAYFDEQLDTWMAFDHAGVLRILNDTTTFSSGYGFTEEIREHVHPNMVGMWAADDPRHADLRAAVAEPFRRSVLDRLAVDVRQIVTALLDGVAAGTGTVEIVSALARPLPSQVICRVLGLDIVYAERVLAWLDEAYEVSATASTMPEQRDQAEFFEQLIVDRRAAPQSGLVDDLIAAQACGHVVDGRPMTDRDLVGYFSMMLSAGVDTTSTGIGNALLFLTEYGHWAELGTDRSLVPNAVEETLRWYPPFPGVRRLTIANTELGGQHVRSGQWATGWLTAANRDPGQFRDPGSFDIRRRPNRHLSFGYGRHVCLGAALARLEMRILLEEATRRLPGLRRDPDASIDRRYWLVDNLTEAHFTFNLATAR
jgi:cytochrome P450